MISKEVRSSMKGTKNFTKEMKSFMTEKNYKKKILSIKIWIFLKMSLRNIMMRIMKRENMGWKMKNLTKRKNNMKRNLMKRKNNMKKNLTKTKNIMKMNPTKKNIKKILLKTMM